MMQTTITRPKWMPGGYVDILKKFDIDTIEFTFPRAARRVMRKPKPIKPSDFAEKYRVVNESVIEGPWKNIFSPYIVGIMDAMDYPSVQTGIICKCVQSAGSESVHNFMAYSVDRKPGPVMYVYPNKDAGRKQLKKRILPIFKDSPHLKRHLTGAVNDETSMEISLKHTRISIAWAHSPTSLATDPMRYVFFDETDKYPAVAAKAESDPISLGEKRTTTYRRRGKAKIIKLSTPTIKTNPIWVALTEEAQVIFDYFVKCPDCGQYQKMVFGDRDSVQGIKWPDTHDEDPEKIESDLLAWYSCEFCGSKWEDDARDRAARAGHWRSREKNPIRLEKYLELYNPKKIGFHIPAWISYFVSLSESAAAFIRGQKKKTKLKDFKNNYAAEPWKEYETVATPTEDKVLECRCALPPQTVPAEAVALTCGIDVQKVGFWYAVRAWARDYTSWNIDHGHLGRWGDVEALLFDTAYPVQDRDCRMKIWRAGVDTGGGKYADVSSTELTYLWLQDNMGFSETCRVWGVKGSSNPLPSKLKMGNVLNKTPSGKPLKMGMRLVIVDPNTGKDVFHDRLEKARQNMTGGAWLHAETGMDYAAMIAAEEKQAHDKGGEIWVQIGNRDNHYIDCEYFNCLLADWEWPGGGVNLLSEPVNLVADEKKPAEKKKKINPFTGGRQLFGV